jgi:hypothetical protein
MNFSCDKKAEYFYYYPEHEQRGKPIFLKRCKYHDYDKYDKYDNEHIITEEEAMTYEVLE